ncbi:MAG: N-acetyltransferase [Archaeoglobaceae archaeon]
MIVRPLEKEDIAEAVRILLLSFDRELSVVFKDVYFAGEILREFFSRDAEGCFVAEKERVLGFSRISFGKHDVSSFLREKLGFLEGLRASLLLKFLIRKPKRGEAFIDFIAVSPLRRNEGIGSAMMEKLIEVAKKKEVRRLNCVIRADSDAVSFFQKFGFEVANILENKLAEKYFSSRQWLLMSKDLSANE